MPISCPEKSVLEQLLNGRLPDPQVLPLEHHILECLACAQTIESLSSQDTLAEMLQTRGLPSQPEAVQALLEQVKARLKTAAALSDVATQGFDSGTMSAEDYFPFLSPPQGAGEIGRLGNYRILKVLGQGGMGVVFAAEDVRLGRSCAVKAMLPEIARKASSRERFLREAKIAGNLEHDHIVAIYQVDEANGIPFIAMPLLHGCSLDDWLRKDDGGTMKDEKYLPFVLKIGIETAQGLAAAHAMGLVHRDIKPANLWLQATTEASSPSVSSFILHPSSFRIKILDFGLARATSGEQNLTQSGAIVGTPAYMAPEQARGEKLDARADLFSLGCVLYRLCTGHVPFKGIDTMSTLLALATQDPSPPIDVNPRVPRQLSELVMKLLSKDVGPRVATAHDALKALQEIDPNTVATLAKAPAPDAIQTHPSPRPDPRAASPSLPGWSIARPESRRMRRIAVACLILAFLGLGGWWLASVIRLETEYGTLIIEINDNDVEARIKDGKLLLTDADGKVRYTLSPTSKKETSIASIAPGEYTIRVEGADGLLLSTDKFEMRRNGEVRVRVRLDPNSRLPFPPALPGAPITDKDAIQGRWLPISGHANGKPMPEAMLKSISTVVFTTESMSFTQMGQRMEGSYHLDPGTSPRRIDVIRTSDQKGMHGIYSLDKDELRLCLGEPGTPRPTAFTSTPGSTTMAIVLRRQESYALRFQDRERIDRVEIPSVKLDVTKPYTVEAWVSVLESNDQLDDIVTVPGMHLTLGKAYVTFRAFATPKDAEDPWFKQFFGKETSFSVSSPQPLPKGQRVHVAGVRADKELRLYVNGKLAQRGNFPALVAFEGPVHPAHLGNSKFSSLGQKPSAWLTDQVRISKAARYDQDFTPAQRSAPDGDTIALYHFDEGQGETLGDFSGNGHHGAIVGAAWAQKDGTPRILPQFPLAFDGKAEVTVPTLKSTDWNKWTIEAWVTPTTLQQADGASVVDFPGQIGLFVSGGTKWKFGNRSFATQTAIGDANVPVHLAGVYDAGRISLFWNGYLVSRVDQPDLKIAPKAHLILGKGFVGSIRTVRISKTARYHEDFQPPPRRLEILDTNTLALYRFEKGEGDELHDSSGNGHHGKIIGAKWVKADPGR